MVREVINDNTCQSGRTHEVNEVDTLPAHFSHLNPSGCVKPRQHCLTSYLVVPEKSLSGFFALCILTRSIGVSANP